MNLALAETTACPRRWPSLGKSFVHPLFDYLFIGGGLSLLLIGGMHATGRLAAGVPGVSIITLVLVCNMAHFAASTVRLYSKPRAFHELPFYTLWLPLLTVVALSLAIHWSALLGEHVHALYLTWSPFHYAAQTYGLAAMYALRSGCALGAEERRLLWGICLLPFAYAFVASSDAGLAWWIVPAVWQAHPQLENLREVSLSLLEVVCFAAPLLVAMHLHLRRGVVLPWISWLLVGTNALWWIGFTYLHAFGWATVFHGVQYLAIAMVFHVRDHSAPTASLGRKLGTAAVFYAACLGLGYTLFKIWPYTYVGLGYTLADSMLLCTAIINLHHFIVDRVIWRVRADANLAIVVGAGLERADG